MPAAGSRRRACGCSGSVNAVSSDDALSLRSWAFGSCCLRSKCGGTRQGEVQSDVRVREVVRCPCMLPESVTVVLYECEENIARTRATVTGNTAESVSALSSHRPPLPRPHPHTPWQPLGCPRRCRPAQLSRPATFNPFHLAAHTPVTAILWHTENCFCLRDRKQGGTTWIHSHWKAIVEGAVLTCLLDGLRGKRSVPPTEWSVLHV